MFRTTAPACAVRRLSVLTAAVLAASVALAAPASAHVEVEAPGAAALAENVTLAFTAETESDTAGITALEVILPDGVAPADITYGKGPKGWRLAATARGYTVSGPAIAVGGDAAYTVTVRQLPDAESLAFKTLQSYDDGRVDRWIELEEPADGGHGSPAPTLALRPAAPGAEPVGTGPATEPTTGSSADTSPSPSDDPSDAAAGPAAATDDGTRPLLFVGLGVVVVVALAGGAWWFRRRSGAGSV
ncbi:DUF1775 domain-containing protein [Streptomyces lushanensis]|uniref:DUF1775 domain-containing protein n=1 Tax=Streptomyces lushanensis TaxID=1434255 RepID=UPI000832CEDE|nr:DUF1775 domain-containing protein [Streptomyces lushanensis]